VFSRTTTRSMSDRLSECFETYLKGYKDHRTIDVYKHTEITGRMLAYKSRIFRSATMGDEYPTTFFDGELKRQTDIEFVSMYAAPSDTHTLRRQKGRNHIPLSTS
jgi:hypothetical protein